MTAIFLVWNPDRWNDWNYTAVVEQVRETGQFHSRWDLALPAEPAGGDAWLLLQGKNMRGLLGHGAVITVQPAADPGGLSTRLIVAFDSLLPLGDQIAPEILMDAIPDVPWNAVRSGQAIEPAAEARIRDLWRLEGPGPTPESALPVPGTSPAWAVSTIAVNRYERDPAARRACIAHSGTTCAACGFSFEIAYGEAGRDHIDVHHTVPASLLDSTYRLDPVTDLIPLCANCHAMAHLGATAPRSLSELRQLLAAAGFIRGRAVSPGELEAQKEAQRILGPAPAGPGHPPGPER